VIEAGTYDGPLTIGKSLLPGWPSPAIIAGMDSSGILDGWR